MPRKATNKKPAPKAETKKLTCIQFLRDLYTKDNIVSNEKACRLLRARFAMSNATTKSIITWKKILRDEGMDIPVQRVGKKKVAKKKTTKKKA